MPRFLSPQQRRAAAALLLIVAAIAIAALVRGGSGGRTVKVGTAATVTYLADGQTTPNRLRVTVQSIAQGPISDLKGLGLDASLNGIPPVYAKVTLTNLGPGPLADNGTNDGIPDAFNGVNASSNLLDAVSFIGSFPPCPPTEPPDPIKVGQTVTTCLTFVIRGGITGVNFTGSTNTASETPQVTWTK